jgi:hypothetical protein
MLHSIAEARSRVTAGAGAEPGADRERITVRKLNIAPNALVMRGNHIMIGKSTDRDRDGRGVAEGVGRRGLRP